MVGSRLGIERVGREEEYIEFGFYIGCYEANFLISVPYDHVATVAEAIQRAMTLSFSYSMKDWSK